MPHLDLAFLADAAEAEPGRKFYVLGGGIDTITAAAFPVVHPQIALVMRIMAHPSEVGREHAMEITLTDADGLELAKVQGQFVPAPGGAPGRMTGMNVVMNFVGTRFPAPGDYEIAIVINGQHQKSLPLSLHAVTSPN